jgi:ABC-type polysaccharide/polyol phosphate export permease
MGRMTEAHVYSSSEQRRVSRVIPDLIRSRQLLLDLIWKDLRARYRYAVMGFLWAVLEPLAFMLILTFVFWVLLADKASFAKGDTETPFALMLLCGLVFWQYTATALNAATLSLVQNANLVKKVYFSREVVPLAAVCFPVVNMAIGFVLLLALQLILGGSLSVALIWVPFVFAIQFVLTVGLSLLFSCGHVHFRDVGNMVNVALTFGFYASPVFYPLEKVVSGGLLPGWAKFLYSLNPMAELLTAYRQILFQHRFPDVTLLIWPGVLAVGCLVLGVVVFRRAAPTLADHL